MTTIASLDVELAAKDAKLKRDLRRARREWRRYSRAVAADTKRALSSVTRMAAAGGAALAALSAKSLQAADDIAKSARNAGLAADEYQRLSHVFDLAGSSAATLAKANQALHRNILLAADGTVTAERAFGRLGLTYKDLERLSPAEQFRLVINRLRGLDSATERSALSQQLLGRAGKELGSVFAASAGAIAAQERRLDRLGGVINQRALSAVEAFNDEVSLLTRVVRTQYTQGMTDAMSTTQQWDRVIMQAGQAARSLGGVLPRIVAVVLEFRFELALLVAGLLAFKAVAVGAAIFTGLKNLYGALAALVKISRSLTFAKLGLIAVFAGLAAGGVAAFYVIRQIREKWDEFADYFRSIGARIEVSWQLLWARAREVFLRLYAWIVGKLRDLVSAVRHVIPGGDSAFGAVEDRAGRMGDALDSARRKVLQLEYLLRQLRETAAERPELGIGKAMREDYEAAVAAIKERLRDLRRALGLEGGTALDRFPSGLPTGTGAGGTPGGAVTGAVLGTGIKWEGPRVIPGELPEPIAFRFGRQFGTTLAQSLGEALRTGDWSSVGDSLLVGLNREFTEDVVEKLSKVFSSLFTRIFSRLNFGGAGGVGGGGGVLDWIGGLFGGSGGGGRSLFGLRFHSGGIVPGPRGSERLAVVQAREAVFTEDQQRALFGMMGGGRPTVELNATLVGDVDQAVIRAIRRQGRLIGDISRERLRVEGIV